MGAQESGPLAARSSQRTTAKGWPGRRCSARSSLPPRPSRRHWPTPRPRRWSGCLPAGHGSIRCQGARRSAGG
eukprot:6344094-Heterocapsa_arctica.AAC.1